MRTPRHLPLLPLGLLLAALGTAAAQVTLQDALAVFPFGEACAESPAPSHCPFASEAGFQEAVAASSGERGTYLLRVAPGASMDRRAMETATGVRMSETVRDARGAVWLRVWCDGGADEARGVAAAWPGALEGDAGVLPLLPEFKRPPGAAAAAAGETPGAAAGVTDAVVTLLSVDAAPREADALALGRAWAADGLPAGTAVSVTRRSPAFTAGNADRRDVATVRAAVFRLPAGADAAAAEEWLSARAETVLVQRSARRELANSNLAWQLQSFDEASKATPLFDAGLDGTGEVVGVVDSGVAATSCYFEDAGEAVADFSGTVGPFAGVVFQSETHRKIAQLVAYINTGDQDGHGTHVSGTLAGSIADGDPESTPALAAQAGVAPGARLAVFDAGDAVDTSAIFVPNDLGDVFAAARSAGAGVHSNSWGGLSISFCYAPGIETFYSPSVTLDSLVSDSFMYEHDDFLTVYAAGNSAASLQGACGRAQPVVLSPALAKNSLAVGSAVNSADSFTGGSCVGLGANCTSHVSTFSQSGPTPDHRIKPDVVATGQVVNSADSASSCGTRQLQGTSMATPVVSGAAALARQYFREGRYPSGSPTPANAMTPSGALLKAVVVHSALELNGTYLGGQSLEYWEQGGALAASDARRNLVVQGYGRPVLGGVLRASEADTGLYVRGDADEGRAALSSQNGTSVHFFNVTDTSRQLRATLAWTDPPSQAYLQLVNDLDLVVTSPDGSTTVARGNAEFVARGAVLANAAGGDGTNNVEHALIEPADLVPGLWRVEVTGVSVPLGPQPFALVVTGGFSDAGAGGCDDGVRNGNEEGVDCGGACPAAECPDCAADDAAFVPTLVTADDNSGTGPLSPYDLVSGVVRPVLLDSFSQSEDELVLVFESSARFASHAFRFEDATGQCGTADSAPGTWSERAASGGTCRSAWVARLPLTYALASCGFRATSSDGFTDYTATVTATTTEESVDVFGSPTLLTVETAHTVVYRLPEEVAVQSAAAAVSGALITRAAVTTQVFDLAAYVATVRVVTSVQHPYRLFLDTGGGSVDGVEVLSPVQTATTGFAAAVAEDASVAATRCLNVAGTDCVQGWDVTLAPGSQQCDLISQLRLTWSATCTSSASCDLPERSSDTFEFSLSSDDFCARAVEVASVSASLVTYGDAAYAVPSVNFVQQGVVYGEVAVEAEAGARISSVSLIDVTAGGVALLAGGAPVEPAHTAASFAFDDAAGTANATRFSFALATGTVVTPAGGDLVVDGAVRVTYADASGQALRSEVRRVRSFAARHPHLAARRHVRDLAAAQHEEAELRARLRALAEPAVAAAVGSSATISVGESGGADGPGGGGGGGSSSGGGASSSSSSFLSVGAPALAAAAVVAAATLAVVALVAARRRRSRAPAKSQAAATAVALPAGSPATAGAAHSHTSLDGASLEEVEAMYDAIELEVVGEGEE